MAKPRILTEYDTAEKLAAVLTKYGSITATAQALGVNPNSLYQKAKRMGVKIKWIGHYTA